MSEIRFKLKKLVGFNWSSLSDDQRKDIIKHIFEFPLIGAEPNRFGFVKCGIINENQIYGYFTQELKEEKHRYNDKKEEEKYIDRPFEDFFFILLFDTGLCLLQSRRIKNVSMSTIEERFAEALRSIFEEFGMSINLEDYSLSIGKEEFIRIFNTENILSLRVDSLKGRNVPEGLKILNPDFEKDPIIRAFFNDDFKHIDEIYISADRDGGLQKSKLSKTVLNTGDPREIEFIGEGNKKVIVRDKIGPSISLDINIESPKTKDIQREIEKFFSKSIMKQIKENIKVEKSKHVTLSDFFEGQDDTR